MNKKAIFSRRTLLAALPLAGLALLSLAPSLFLKKCQAGPSPLPA